MRTLRHVLRGIRPLDNLSRRKWSAQKSPLRCMSTALQSKLLSGTKGEKIIMPPDGDISYEDIHVAEYIWRNVEQYPNKIALECAITGRKYTYAQARDASNYVARSLRKLGLKEGDTVALITPNIPESGLALTAIVEAGMIATMVNPIATADEISKQFKIADVKATIVAREVYPVANAVMRKWLPPSAPFVVIDDGTGPMPEGVITFESLITRGKSLPSFTISRSTSDVAVLPFSSGTTGLPKGVMLTHRNLVSNMQMVYKSIGKDMRIPTTDTYQEVTPLFLPVFHILGMNGILLPNLAEGAKLVTLPKFMPDTFLNMMEKSKPTILFCAPPVVIFLSASPAVQKRHIERVHHAFSGAAPLSKEDVERFYDRFKLDGEKLKFCQGYGLTETSPVCFVEKHGKKYASIGKNVSGCDVRLVDPTTNLDIDTPGQCGELWVRGPHIMKGYLNNEEATNQVLSSGWLKTGDIAYFDQDLDFFITDRLKELIKVKGYQVAPAELEALLRTHPDIAEAAVIGIPDARSGEVPKAFVLPKKDRKLSEDEIKNFVKEKVSEYKELAGGVTFVDSIPKNPTGKILRMHLKQMYMKQSNR